MNFIAWYFIIGLALIGMASAEHVRRCPNDERYTKLETIVVAALVWPYPVAAGLWQYWTVGPSRLKCKNETVVTES